MKASYLIVNGNYSQGFVQLATNETSQKFLRVEYVICIVKLTFCGGISRILFGPMILCLDREVVW